MKQTVTFTTFVDAFTKFNGRYDQLGGYDGLKALFDYLEDYENSTGEEFELDVIALCCEYSYFETLEEYNEQYGEECESIADVEDHAPIIPVNDTAFIVMNH